MPTIDEKLDAILAGQKEAKEREERILRGLTLLARHLGAVPPASGSSSSGAATQPVPDDVLDAPGGDPTVRFEVKAWTNDGGDKMKGNKLSQCPAPFLDLYAGAMESSAGDPEKARFRDENLRGARLARGWAARLRAGWRPAGVAPPPPDETPPDDVDL